MTPPLKHGPPGSPQDWLAHAESDLNLARVARERKDVLPEHPEAALEHAKLFAEFPISTQLAVMRRRRKLSQRAMAKKVKVPQPHIARTESLRHDPRISSVVRAAKALRCHVLLVPDEELNRLATA